MGQLKEMFEWALSYEAPSYINFAAATLIVLGFGFYLFTAMLLFTVHPVLGFGFAIAVPCYVIWLGWRNK